MELSLVQWIESGGIQIRHRTRFILQRADSRMAAGKVVRAIEDELL
jgi:hypothetical protein